MRGTVAMKVDNNTAHVCLGDNDVKIGDKIAFYKTKCTVRSGMEADGTECKMLKLGQGSVVKILNTHYSTVKVDNAFNFEEGTLVEKKL